MTLLNTAVFIITLKAFVTSPTIAPKSRAEAIALYQSLAGKDAIPVLREIAINKNEPGAIKEKDLDGRIYDYHPVRLAALRAIDKLDSAEANRIGESLLKDENERPDLRIASVDVLKEFQKEKAEPLFIDLFTNASTPEEVRYYLGTKIGEVGSKAGVSAIREYLTKSFSKSLTHESPEVALAFTLSFQQKPEVQLLMREILKNPKVPMPMRTRIANGIGREGPADALPELIQLLEDPSFQVPNDRRLTQTQEMQTEDLINGLEYHFFRFPEKAEPFRKSFPTKYPILNQALNHTFQRPKEKVYPPAPPSPDYSELEKRASAKDACSSLCQTARQFSKWGQVGFSEFAVNQKSSDDERNEGNAAIRSLGTLFLIRASRFCPEVREAAEKAGQVCIKGMSTPVRPADNSAPKADSPDTIQKFVDENKEQFDPETLARLREFSEKVRNSTEKAAPTNAYQTYAKQYYGLLLRALLATPDLKDVDRTNLNQELEKNQNSMRLDLSRFSESLTGTGGSLFNNYALASAVLSTPLVPDSTLLAMRDMASINSDPLAIPYSYGSDSETPRGGAARAVPFHLTLYLKGSETKMQQIHSRGHLLRAINGFIEHSAALRFQTQRDGAHVGKDALAPYYFYPNLPFVSTAIAVLQKDPELSTEEIKQLSKMKSQLKGIILSMQDENGFFQRMGLRNYSSSPQYVNPLAGLALMPLIESCEISGKKVSIKDSFGILDPELVRTRLRAYDRSSVAPPKPKH